MKIGLVLESAAFDDGHVSLRIMTHDVGLSVCGRRSLSVSFVIPFFLSVFCFLFLCWQYKNLILDFVSPAPLQVGDLKGPVGGLLKYHGSIKMIDCAGSMKLFFCRWQGVKPCEGSIELFFSCESDAYAGR